MHLLIIRHAEPDYELDSITEEGRNQAEKLGERLAKLKIDDIYVSTAGRAQKTAAPTLRRLGKKPQILWWLRELEIEGYPWGKPHNKYIKSGRFGTVHDWKEGYFAGEDTARVYKMVAQKLDLLLAEYGYHRENNLYRVEDPQDDMVAIFCHSATTRALLAHLLHWSLPLAFANISTPVTGVAWVEFPARDGEAIPRLKLFGDVSHLGDNLKQFSQKS